MEDVFKSDPFYYRVSGALALFTDPFSKGGGEKFSYLVPTYQALKGITEQIYWKPTIVHVIDEVKIIKKIKTESKGVLALMVDGKKDLNNYTYLVDVEYLVKFHFEWNLDRKDMVKDRDEKKHEQIILRSLKIGGRRDAFLGTRECYAYIEKLKKNDYESYKSEYDGESLSFGIMFHSFSYPSENMEYAGHDEGKLIANYSDISMDNGIIKFPKVEDCKFKNEISNYKIKKFDFNKMMSLDETLKSMED